MRVAYVGNFGPEHSTENHVRRALESLDVEVIALQESNYDWTRLTGDCDGAEFMLWTRTAGHDPPDMSAQWEAIKTLPVPSVSYHLDRFWGIIGDGREYAIGGSPFFHTDLVCTADGGHDQAWAMAGINHRWYPPAVLAEEAQLGTPQDHYRTDVAFVGNLTHYGHTEWASYRRALYRFLVGRYRRAFRFYPSEGRPAIRGKPLQDLYASVKIVIGDSCLAGGVTRYWSDRIPETLGRGGFLIHPQVDGLLDEHPDLITYPLGEFDVLGELIDYYLNDVETRQDLTVDGRRHVLNHHTYQHRMRRLIREVEQL